jgi:cell division protein FtsI/penicillin-binding protein 2
VRALAGRSHADPRLAPGELALAPWAPAASLFKIVTALALLSDASFDPQETVCFSGGQSGIGERHMEDPPPEDKNAVCENLETALANSSNAVLGKLARRHLDARRLRDAAAACGFNQALPFEFEVGRSVFRFLRTIPIPWRFRGRPPASAMPP